MTNLNQKIEKIRKSHGNGAKLIYEWIQKKEINVEEFEELVQENEKEKCRQMALDRFD